MISLAHDYAGNHDWVRCMRCGFESKISDLGGSSAFCVPHHEKDTSGYRDYPVEKMNLVRSIPLTSKVAPNGTRWISIDLEKLRFYHKRQMFPLTEAGSGRREVA